MSPHHRRRPAERGTALRRARLAVLVPLVLLAGCASDDDAPPPTPTATEPGAPSVTLTVDGSEQVLELTEVVCSGEPGRIAHVEGTTDGEPPLVEAGTDRFVMVHLGSGEPHRSEDPAGVSYAEESVTFSGVTLSGGASVDGTLTCTVWEE